MEKQLTIGICTRDRSCLGTCLRRLSVLPGIETVEVIVGDNSTYDSYIQANREVVEGYKFKFFHVKDFMEARNRVVKECSTKYFMWLDDDDYLSMDAITVINHICEVTDADFISFGVKKEGRIQIFDYKVTDISSMKLRYKYLNRFDHYVDDRETKVYLWNCAIAFKAELVKSCKPWKMTGCDDIIPVTDMYLNAQKVVRANIPILYYNNQTYVTSKKSAEEVCRLEAAMRESYRLLVSYYLVGERNKYKKLILLRAINNSYRQLEFNDDIQSSQLKDLYDYLKSEK